MKRTYLFVAAAALLTASCADDSSLGGGNDLAQSKVIAFDMQTPAMRKATENGQTAATKLGNEFIVWGEKNETNGTAADGANQVFKNYKVEYTASSAYTTTSNTKDWEYVGFKPYEETKVSPTIGTDKTQTIKYWDYSANSYTFTAVSALKTDIENGNVKITKTTSGTDQYAKGYTIELKSGATASSIYVADRNFISKPATAEYNREATNQYGGNATFTFRNFQSKVRFALYEVIPGYKVKVTSVKFNGDTENTTNFGVTGKFIKIADGTKYTVTYEDGQNGTTLNKATVKVDASSPTESYLEGGANIFADALGTSSIAPTYDTNDGGYTAIQPDPDNDKNMKLTISYKLISEDTGEEIKVENKTAEVPAAFCKWKPNFAYTYIFKITDNAAELYPITFDAQVKTDENGAQETITTVDEPSITTFAVTGDDTNGYTTVTGKDEYAADNTIYASIVSGGTVITELSGVKVYSVTTSDNNFPITAASVANAIENKDKVTGTAKITATELANETTSTVTDVPVGDGTKAKRSLSAISWKATANTTYAVEYTYTDNSTTKKIYKIVIAK
jgi:hypothetical protein